MFFSVRENYFSGSKIKHFLNFHFSQNSMILIGTFGDIHITLCLKEGKYRLNKAFKVTMELLSVMSQNICSGWSDEWSHINSSTVELSGAVPLGTQLELQTSGDISLCWITPATIWIVNVPK